MRRLLPSLLALFSATLSATTAQAETLYVRAGQMIDSEAGTVLRDRLIRIEDGRIVAVTAWSPPPQGAKVIDWSAHWVLPGLIDTHVHLADIEQSANVAEPLLHSEAAIALRGAGHARKTLMAGFTTVHDVGSYRAFANVALRDAIERGDVIGPRISAVGAYVTVPGGGGEVTGLAPDVAVPASFRAGVASGPAEVRTKVNYLLQNGADSIKLIATGAVLTQGTEPGALEMSEAEIRAAVEAAAARGSWVTAHAHGAEGIKVALRAGVRGIEHASLIDDEGIALAKAKGAFLSMDIYNGDFIAEVGKRDGWSADILRKNDETTEAQRIGFRKAVKAGVQISFGTDAGVYPHGQNARQFAYMVRWGMTPMQAIQSATIVGARMLGWSERVGAIAPGRFADLVALDENPLTDITALERIDHVMRGGELVR
ncbi:amidohydrolase family protein [Novosphingobium sp.]|jgi:imidazolonepropionase-like amidohydrolase|uniref:Xaa-Pro dipeptidase n=1 Tax=Novosphingobium sp. TaxID=1874826 RepID=UPI0022C0AA58|nr:amidohydrolase family protein [Novosphingobium sp.]MCZ8017485.1 amidohydrolase family protein [Novosphingobium sp.]MCZ8033991.1 amidohydrolase family protein [Novosphingobium sp.]MCZ8051347.1 amidohydrolase family protein [Novosphingobium sp.]MCZ8059693.1 amidohydrolase family protein [Novosphingobium sp.]MCZ8231531.1 amidohydrolase family protein [Novosphingobium sp.]